MRCDNCNKVMVEIKRGIYHCEGCCAIRVEEVSAPRVVKRNRKRMDKIKSSISWHYENTTSRGVVSYSKWRWKMMKDIFVDKQTFPPCETPIDKLRDDKKEGE